MSQRGEFPEEFFQELLSLVDLDGDGGTVVPHISPAAEGDRGTVYGGAETHPLNRTAEHYPHGDPGIQNLNFSREPQPLAASMQLQWEPVSILGSPRVRSCWILELHSDMVFMTISMVTSSSFQQS